MAIATSVANILSFLVDMGRKLIKAKEQSDAQKTSDRITNNPADAFLSQHTDDTDKT